MTIPSLLADIKGIDLTFPGVLDNAVFGKERERGRMSKLLLSKGCEKRSRKRRRPESTCWFKFMPCREEKGV